MKYQKIRIVKKTEQVSPDELVVEEERLVFIEKESYFLWKETEANLHEKAFYLHSGYEWHIVEDDRNQIVLVPLRKKDC